MTKGLLIIILLALLRPALSAQEYDFASLTVEDGLSQSSVTCLAQDEKGFLWVGTRDGLNRYDGQNVTTFRKIPFDTSALQSNVITCLLAEGSSAVYVGTVNGLQRYDQLTNRFSKIHLREDDHPVEVRSLYRDRHNTLWACTTNGFFMVYLNPADGHFEVTPFFHSPELIGQHGVVTHACFQDRDDRYWISTTKGILMSTGIQDGKPTFEHDSSAFISPVNIFQGIQQLPSGEIIGYGNGGLFVYRPDDHEFSPFTQESFFDSDTRISAITQNLFWTNTPEGVSFLTLNENKEARVTDIVLPEIGLSESKHRINFVLKDNIYDDFYWLATDLGGVLRMSKRNKKFETTLLKNIPKLDVTNPYLRHITTTGDNVWINLGTGIVLYRRQKESFEFITSFFPSDFVPSATSISSLHRSTSGNVYASVRDKLIELYLDRDDHVRINRYPVDLQWASETNVMLETENYFIRGGRSGHIVVLQKNTFEELNHFMPVFNNQPGVRSEITSLLVDRQSNLWIGSSDGILIYPEYNPSEGPSKPPIVLAYHADDTTGLIESRITCLLQDSRGVIWVCTRNGLMKANLTNGKVDLEHISHAALQNKVLYGILEDQKTYQFWLSSNQGLYRFDPVRNQVENFDMHDGLQGNEFNSFSFYQSLEGEMFFGGTKGMTSFFPDQIVSDTTLPPVWITQLTTINAHQYNLLARNADVPLELSFAERSFSIEFISLNYLDPTEQDYYYNLKGTADLLHIPLANSQQVNFSQLEPGSYTLEIFSKNKNGNSNTRSDFIHFTIHAPFWRSLWFLVLVAACIAFLGWFLFYLRYQNKLKQLKAVEQVRKNISEDFHDELGSKLSIISMYSEFTKQELNRDNSKASAYLDKVNDTASRLYENTRDLIWALNPQHDSLYDLFLQLKDFGEEMFQDTNIDFHSAGLSEVWKNRNLPMRYKRHLLLIFKEAMHNALKHSGCRNIKLSINEKDDKLIIMLQDDGMGFDIDLENKGDGIKNMSYRAEQLHSVLHVVSKKEGTRIWVALPLNILKEKK